MVFSPQYAPPRKLRRIRALKKIAGVCAGFADYFGMDITLMRLIWVGLAIMPPNVGLIAYPLSWIVLPKE
jgi:phage shock protein C